MNDEIQKLLPLKDNGVFLAIDYTCFLSANRVYVELSQVTQVGLLS